MIFNLVDSATEDLGTGPVTVTFLYYSTKDGQFKTLEKRCASGGSVTAPSDVGNVASTIGDTSVLFQDQHPALTFQEWNISIPASITGDMVIGAIYITSDGKSYFSIRLNAATGLSPSIYFQITSAGTLTVNWGDGNSDTSTTVGAVTISHTYVAGDYWITVSRDTGVYSLGQGSDTTTVIGGNISSYRKALFACYIGASITSISERAFGNCSSMIYVTIPGGVTSISSYAFINCYSLKYAIISTYVTSLTAGVFNRCYSLIYVSISDIPIALQGGMFKFCSSLKRITLSESFTIILSNAFIYCYSLSSLVVPGTVTSISSNAFNSCYALKEYFFYSATPPTLENINAFGEISTSTRIYVPDASVSAYKAATNWSSYANYIYGISSRV